MFMTWLIYSVIFGLLVLGEAIISALLAGFFCFLISPIIAIAYQNHFWVGMKQVFIFIWVVVWIIIDIEAIQYVLNDED